MEYRLSMLFLHALFPASRDRPDFTCGGLSSPWTA